METNNKNTNSILFLEYLIANGFDPSNYRGILELGQSAGNSLSQFLTRYRQYLLSKEVIYSELKRYGIDGAFGYIEENGIVVPKTLCNDQHFLYDAPKVPYKRHSYSYPDISEFDAIVCEGLEANLLDTLELKQDKYYGLCMDIVKATKDNRERIENRTKYLLAFGSLFAFMNDSSKNCYKIVHDQDTKLGKELYLIKRAK